MSALNDQDFHPIPPMTDPMGRSWDQPPRERILVDEKHALMTKADFESLHEYSATMPTGVYPGKMWRRHNGAFDPKCRPEDVTWLLVWYEECDVPSMCSVSFRPVLLVDNL